MHKAQLADQIAAAHGMTKAQAMDVLNTTLGAGKNRASTSPKRTEISQSTSSTIGEAMLRS